MPIGKPNAQTQATKRYQEKIGIIAKTYKLNKQLTEEFAEACRAAGVTQAAKLTELMQNFVNENRQ